MSLAQTFQTVQVDQSIVLNEAQKLASEIRKRVNPSAIFLFGSAAEGRFKTGSDFDILLVFDDTANLRAARHMLRKKGPLTTFAPQDIIFVTQALFDQKKNVGGICHVAFHEGIRL